jgi:hypothetical protein
MRAKQTDRMAPGFAQNVSTLTFSSDQESFSIRLMYSPAFEMSAGEVTERISSWRSVSFFGAAFVAVGLVFQIVARTVGA